ERASGEEIDPQSVVGAVGADDLHGTGVGQGLGGQHGAGAALDDLQVGAAEAQGQVVRACGRNDVEQGSGVGREALFERFHDEAPAPRPPEGRLGLRRALAGPGLPAEELLPPPGACHDATSLRIWGVDLQTEGPGRPTEAWRPTLRVAASITRAGG